MATNDASTLLTVPKDFTRASSSYRFQAWMALLGLLAFMVLYVGLASWFTYITYRMISGVLVGGDGAVAGFFAALPAGFLAIFMWKALIFIRHGSDDPGIEISETDEPVLYKFLTELAEDVGAPRPHRVFISPNVNASVSYDLSILNLIIPTKKNLIIGLGLVNSLNRSEFKAVLAHEFGHFAQRSMAVGRWVYIGEQIASHIITKRDALDRGLDFLSSIDLRVAWIGWIMRSIVWSIRSLTETAFRWVIAAQRALSREMEFQADLVAVSVTGSDALIHALYRLQAADEDWEQCLEFASQQLHKGRMVQDLFAIQTRIGEHKRRVLNDPLRGRVPELPSDASTHRLFSEEIAQPPRMWATHPPNNEREENAKRTYIRAEANQESAWTLFRDPQQQCESLTQYLFSDVQKSGEFKPMSTAEALAEVDKQFSRESYDAVYQGAYLGRPVTIGVASADQLQSDLPPRDAIDQGLTELYPDSLQDNISEYRNLLEELALLEAIQDGHYDATGGVIRHRGQTYNRAELPQLIANVRQDRDDALARIEDHDKKCRTFHNAAARYAGRGWQDYHRSLTKLLHYAEHVESDLKDAHAHLANLTTMSLAAGHVNAKKIRRLVASANDLQGAMAEIDRQSESIVIPAAIAEDLEVEKWREALDKLELPPADEQNIGQWLDVVDSWVIPMGEKLAALRKSALEELLKTERQIARIYREEAEACEAPPRCAEVPPAYATRTRGSERPKQKRLDWWSRFTLADGTAPAILRFAVAFSIVAAVVTAGAMVGSATVVVYNGLAIPVEVAINGATTRVAPNRHRSIDVGMRRSGRIEARADDGRMIEWFEVGLERGFANYVYNVASAAPMVEWTATYGNVADRPSNSLGFPRWRTTGVDHIFTDPPRTIESSGSGGTRSVLTAYSELHPQLILQFSGDPDEQQRVILAHAEWDAADSRYIDQWLSMAESLPGFYEVLSRRLAAKPNDVPALRIQQDAASGERKEILLEQHRQLGDQHPDDPDWQYIAVRAMPDGSEKDAAFMAGYEKWSQHGWFANAAGLSYSRTGDWQAALSCLQVPVNERGPMFDSAAVQIARVRRLVSGVQDADLSDLRDSVELGQRLQLETGEGMQGTEFFAYSRLSDGRLEEAYRLAGEANADNHILVLLATSVGARDEWQQRVLEIPPAELESPPDLIYLAALASRLEQPFDKYLDHYKQQRGQEEFSLVDLFVKLREAGPMESFANELTGYDTWERGAILSAATILFPEQTPDAWKDTAKRVLFVAERPYF